MVVTRTAQHSNLTRRMLKLSVKCQSRFCNSYQSVICALHWTFNTQPGVQFNQDTIYNLKKLINIIHYFLTVGQEVYV